MRASLHPTLGGHRLVHAFHEAKVFYKMIFFLWFSFQHLRTCARWIAKRDRGKRERARRSQKRKPICLSPGADNEDRELSSATNFLKCCRYSCATVACSSTEARTPPCRCRRRFAACLGNHKPRTALWPSVSRRILLILGIG